MNESTITPQQQWANNLEKVITSRNQPTTGNHHEYLKNPQSVKLSIPEIVDISKGHLQQINTDYQEGNLQRKEFVDLTENISNYTLQLITAREAKRNQRMKRILRGVALVVSAVASLFLIGIPFFLKLRENNQKFELEISQLKKEIETQRKLNSQTERVISIVEELVEAETLPKDKKSDFIELLLSVPSMVAVQQAAANEVVKDISGNINKNWKNYKTSLGTSGEVVQQFRVDIERNQSFRRKDNLKQINDPNPLPAIGEKERVNKGLALIKELTEPEDKCWTPILQLGVTQTGLNSICVDLIATILMEGANMSWNESQMQYVIAARFPGEHPPADLEIIRNKKTQRIEKVNVSLEGALNIIKKNTTGTLDITEKDVRKKEEEILVLKAVQFTLNYSLTLGPDNGPVVSDCRASFETNI